MDGYSTLKIRRAIVMASFALADEILFGTDNIPYISEPLGEALIMCLKRVPEKLIIAAILKPAFQRKKLSGNKIARAFGQITLDIIEQKLENHAPLFLQQQHCELEEDIPGYDLSLIKKTVYFAAFAHRGQKRKEAGIPFIIHPVGSAIPLALLRVPQKGIQAEILHDTLEDTLTTDQGIIDLFGQDVCRIVQFCTEPAKNWSWHQRKSHTIEKAKEADLLTKLVICSDKLNNIQSIYDQLLREKLKTPAEFKQAEVWQKFNMDYKWQKWYYQEITRAIFARVGYNDLQPIFGTLMRVVQKVFGETVIKDKYARALVVSR